MQLLRVDEWVPCFSAHQHVVIGPDAQRVSFLVRLEPRAEAAAGPARRSQSGDDFLQLTTSGVQAASDAEDDATSSNYSYLVSCPSCSTSSLTSSCSCSAP